LYIQELYECWDQIPTISRKPLSLSLYIQELCELSNPKHFM